MINDLYAAYKSSNGVSTDSRKIASGNMFFALKGPTFNGNDYIESVLKSGAAYAVADEPRDEFKGNSRIILVDDGLKALQDLARHHRSKLRIPIVGLTGSNGKTTSKELLNAALSTYYTTYATKGNLNNHIGVPLSILAISPQHELAIIEMGANHQKEIEFLCSICRPDLGYITNIGLAHLEGFGGEEGIYTGKKELFDHLRNNEGKLAINVDDPKVVKAAEGSQGITYGTAENAHFQGKASIVDNRLQVSWWRDIDPFERMIKTQLSGIYNFSNVMSAIAVARYYGVPDDKIKKGIEAYTPSNNRSQVEQTDKGNTVIVDCYNANPSSMLAAIDNLAHHEHTSKLAILGDMLELGEAAKEKHREVLEKLSKLKIPAYVAGELFAMAQKEFPEVEFYSTTEEVKEYLQKRNIEHHLILLKGSRKMKLEQLLELL